MKKGFTVLELLVSIVILSIVLTFAMNLFLKVRGAYTNSKTDVAMEITRSIIIDALMSDVNENEIVNISCTKNMLTIQFKNGADLFSKKLAFNTSDSNNDYLTYYTSGQNGGIVRELPKGALIGDLSCTQKSIRDVGVSNHIFHKIEDENSNDYSLDLFIISQN